MLLTEVWFAIRRLRTRSASVLGVIAMLAVGIGLATTMFALSDPFLSRPLPYAREDRLVLIDIDVRRLVVDPGGPQPDYPLLRDWQARTDLFDGLAAFTRYDTLRVRLSDRVVPLEAVAVSADMFSVLGVTAPAPVTPTAFGDEVWLTSHAATGPLGGIELANRTLSLQPSGSLHVAGVLPSSFLVPQPAERVPVDALVELVPGRIAVTAGARTERLSMVGRLRDGVGPLQAEAALNADARRRGFGVTVTALAPVMKAQQRPLAVGALIAGLLVLIVSAANTLGMALTRGLFRAHQIATIEVLGASRARIARLLLAEAVCVASAGTLGALALVPLVFDAIVAVVPRNFIVLGAPELSARVTAFAGLAGLIACGAWWSGSLVAWLRGLRAGLREAVLHDAPVVGVIRFGLTAGQVAVTLVLLTGAGLLVQSYLNLVGQDTGMSGETMALSVSYGPEVTGATLRDTIDRTADRLRRLPGVRRAAAVVGETADQFTVVGVVVIDRVAPVELLWVSPDYFETAGMSFIDGRPLLDSDAGGRGVVVNEALVARYLGGRPAVGEMLRVGGMASPIVGVLKDSRRHALDEAPSPAVFRVLDETAPGMRVTYLASGTTSAAAMFEPLINRISPDAVVLDASTLRARLARTIQDRSFATLVVGLFAVATIVVTAAGIVGVVGYGVARRTREIGIRMAIGATSGSVTWLTMRGASVAIGVGGVMGLIAVMWLSDVASSLLYGVSPRDWTTLAATTFALIGLATAAAIVPARRAGRLSPTVALRDE